MEYAEFINKALKESESILSDLNLIFKHLDKNDGKFLCFLKASVVEDKKRKLTGYIDLHNLDNFEIYECFLTFVKIFKKSLSSSNSCKCEKCVEAADKLKNILDKLEIKE